MKKRKIIYKMKMNKNNKNNQHLKILSMNRISLHNKFNLHNFSTKSKMIKKKTHFITNVKKVNLFY